MIPYEQMPDDNADLAKLDVDFPRLADDSAASCPEPMSEILEYLEMEADDEEPLDPSRLQFLRTARVGDQDFWIWSFQESDGTDCYVTVSREDDGSTCIGFEGNDYGLTPEQFMLGTYHEVF